MADPNQTPKRGSWACPCSGCQKAVAYEREQLIYLLEYMKHNDYAEDLYNMFIDIIKARMPKVKKK